ncbi:MTM1 [Candida pseudojiufengensis]|uniref:MTM1 n=1 Tax=Candida pseudojiufengensis TaxID=497109 RepID=UPI00222454CF|nr:MTM1 [Candida pseudojiufengensis]KAI5960410.1 MTM1 [Candida pseudojiufengensis]
MSLSSEIAGAIDEPDLSPSPTSSPSSVAIINGKMLNDENISITQRMISACSGSLITSLVVTPFDVIRIRIQQQGILPQSEPCCELHFPNHFGKNASKFVAPELFWIHNNYCKIGAENCSRITSTFQGFATVAKHEGIATLWRGLSLTLLMAVPSNIIYFTGYEYIRDHSPFQNYPFNPLLCGALARMISATSVAPAELLKTRLQSIPTDSRNSSHVLSNLLKDSYIMVKKDGIKTLFKGLQITLWRDVPFSGIYWSSYEFFKGKISHILKTDFNNTTKTTTTTGNPDDYKVFITSFLSGSISGTIAAFFTNPFDVGKTRLQITMNEDPNVKKPNMFKFLYDIYKREGIRALYAGFGPRVMKIAPACAIMISSYEVGKKIFKNVNSNDNDNRS